MRILDVIVRPLMRIGVPMGPDVLLTVPGRRTGRPRSTPVAVAEIAGRLWLVAPFGEADWVLNLRAAGRGKVRSGLRTEELTARELSEDERLWFFREVLEPYARGNSVVRWIVRNFDRIPEDPAEAARTNIVFEMRRVL